MAVYLTRGNAYGHLILRGGKTPNYHAADIATAHDKLRAYSLPEYLVVDFSHGNSQKIARNQLVVAEDVCRQIRTGSATVAGIMAESFLVEGAQSVASGQALTYGQSITDPCLNWEDSEHLLAILVETAPLSAHVVAEYCRRKGLYPEQIQQWKNEIMQPDPREEKALVKKQQNEIHQLKREIAARIKRWLRLQHC